MKKRMMSILIAITCTFSIGLMGCSGKEENKEEKKEITTLKIGASPNVIEVVNAMEDSLEKEGYKLEVVTFDGKRKIASTLTFFGGCFVATSI